MPSDPKYFNQLAGEIQPEIELTVPLGLDHYYSSMPEEPKPIKKPNLDDQRKHEKFMGICLLICIFVTLIGGALVIR